MERTARPATVEDLKLLIKSLNDEGAEYLLIGAYALFALGYQRATTDIDLLVPQTLESGARVKRALLALPEKAAEDIDPRWFETDETIRVADEFIVDLLFNACGETYASLQPHAVTIDFDGIPVRTLDLAGMLKTKQSTRDRDRMDRFALERALAERERPE
jgi:predicted nucleotidyltransferase